RVEDGPAAQVELQGEERARREDRPHPGVRAAHEAEGDVREVRAHDEVAHAVDAEEDGGVGPADGGIPPVGLLAEVEQDRPLGGAPVLVERLAVRDGEVDGAPGGCGPVLVEGEARRHGEAVEPLGWFAGHAGAPVARALKLSTPSGAMTMPSTSSQACALTSPATFWTPIRTAWSRRRSAWAPRRARRRHVPLNGRWRS